MSKDTKPNNNNSGKQQPPPKPPRLSNVHITESYSKEIKASKRKK